MRTLREERKREQRRTAVALAVSLLIHLTILLAALIFLSLKPSLKKLVPPPKPKQEPVEVTFIPPPPEPPKKKEKDFIDSSRNTASDKAPEHADYESDQNSLAASLLPPKGNEPTPTLEGENSPVVTLQAQSLSLGPGKQPTPPSSASPARQEQTAQKQEKPQPQPTPPEKETKEAKTTPTPRPTPRPEDSELALLDPSRPKPRPPEPKKQAQKKPEQPSPPSRPQPPAFQQQQRVTRLTGGITNRGPASMNAVATPLGRYKKMLSDAIGSRWYYYIQEVLDLVNVGTVQLRFVVRADGKVEGVKVLSNSSNESLASCSVRSIIEAEIPPIPKDVAAALAGNKLEVDYSFTIVGQ